MKNPILYILLLFGLFTHAQTPTFEWAKQMGGTGQDVGESIVTDQFGNVYTFGYFNGYMVDFDPGPGIFNLTSDGGYDIFILKLDVNGNFVWAKRLGGPSVEPWVSGVLDEFGNIYITSTFSGTVDFDPGIGVYNLMSDASIYMDNSDIFILKLDSSGNFLWANKMGGARNDNVSCIKMDPSGCFYITGQLNFRDDASFNVYADIFVSKFDSSGNILWTELVVGTSTGSGSTIAVANGCVYVLGYFYGTFDFDSGSGTFNLSNWGSYSGFLLKLNNFGGFISAKKIAGYPSSVVVDALQNLYISSNFTGISDFDPGIGVVNLTSFGGRDICIFKLDPRGDFVFAKQLGGTSEESVYTMVADECGNVYTTGYFSGTSDFDPSSSVVNLTTTGSRDIFVSKLDASGNFIWAKNMETTSFTDGISIAVDKNDNVYTIGEFSGTTDFDPEGGIFNLTSFGSSYDIFIHKITQSPICEGASSENEDFFQLYPNPTTGYFTIESLNNTTVSIINIIGQEMLRFPVPKYTSIDVSFLANGIYFVKDLNNGGSVKFVKQ